MECWNAGILGIKAEINHFNCKKLLQTHHSITPSFHHSIIPTGAKPLSPILTIDYLILKIYGVLFFLIDAPTIKFSIFNRQSLHHPLKSKKCKRKNSGGDQSDGRILERFWNPGQKNSFTDTCKKNKCNTETHGKPKRCDKRLHKA